MPFRVAFSSNILRSDKCTADRVSTCLLVAVAVLVGGQRAGGDRHVRPPGHVKQRGDKENPTTESEDNVEAGAGGGQRAGGDRHVRPPENKENPTDTPWPPKRPPGKSKYGNLTHGHMGDDGSFRLAPVGGAITAAPVVVLKPLRHLDVDAVLSREMLERLVDWANKLPVDSFKIILSDAEAEAAKQHFKQVDSRCRIWGLDTERAAVDKRTQLISAILLCSLDGDVFVFALTEEMTKFPAYLKEHLNKSTKLWCGADIHSSDFMALAAAKIVDTDQVSARQYIDVQTLDYQHTTGRPAGADRNIVQHNRSLSKLSVKAGMTDATKTTMNVNKCVGLAVKAIVREEREVQQAVPEGTRPGRKPRRGPSLRGASC